MKYIVTLLACLIFNTSLHFAQSTEEAADNFPAFLVHLDYAYQLPAGDLADRFGNNSNIGVGLLYKTSNNWLLGADGHFLFGNNIQEGFASNLSSSSGFVLGVNGLNAEVNARQQGLSFEGKIGKMFSKVGASNPNSGFTVLIGVGYLQHKIQIEDRDGAVPQFQGDYKKGYDRLTSGFAFSQFIGYTHLSLNKRINFFIGIEAMQAFTKGRRTTDFNTGADGTSSRVDILFGPKVGWILPLYKEPSEGFYTH